MYLIVDFTYQCNPILLLFHWRPWWGLCHRRDISFDLVQVGMTQVDIQRMCCSPYCSMNQQGSLLKGTERLTVLKITALQYISGFRLLSSLGCKRSCNVLSSNRLGQTCFVRYLYWASPYGEVSPDFDLATCMLMPTKVITLTCKWYSIFVFWVRSQSYGRIECKKMENKFPSYVYICHTVYIITLNNKVCQRFK